MKNRLLAVGLTLATVICGFAQDKPAAPPAVPAAETIPDNDKSVPKKGGKTPNLVLGSKTAGLTLSSGDVTIDSKKRYLAIKATTDKAEMEVVWLVRSGTGVEYLQFDASKMIVIFPNDSVDTIDVVAFSSTIVDGKARNIGPVRALITVTKADAPKPDAPKPDAPKPDTPVPGPVPGPGHKTGQKRLHISVVFNGVAPDKATAAILEAPQVVKYIDASKHYYHEYGLANSKDVASLKRSGLGSEAKQVPWLILQDTSGNVLRSIRFPDSVNALVTEIDNSSLSKD